MSDATTACAGGCGTTAALGAGWMCGPCREGARVLNENAIRLAREEGLQRERVLAALTPRGMEGAAVPILRALEAKGFNVVFATGSPDPLKLDDGDRRFFLADAHARERHYRAEVLGDFSPLPKTLGWPGGDVDLEPYRDAVKGLEAIGTDVIRGKLVEAGAWRGPFACTGAMKAIGWELRRSSYARGDSHDLFRTGDADAPPAILDRNGAVTLGLCRRCGQGEADLAPSCPGQRS